MLEIEIPDALPVVNKLYASTAELTTVNASCILRCYLRDVDAHCQRLLDGALCCEISRYLRVVESLCTQLLTIDLFFHYSVSFQKVIHGWEKNCTA